MYDVTDVATDVAWTTTGVIELTNGVGYSTYYHSTTETAGNSYIISFKDSTNEYTQDILVSEGESITAMVAIPTISGSVYQTTAIQETTMNIVRGDTPTITFDLEENYSGWTPYFGIKKTRSQSTYDMTPRACTWTSATLGTGYISLTATETDLLGQYQGEVELRNGTSRLTVISLKLIFQEDIIK